MKIMTARIFLAACCLALAVASAFPANSADTPDLYQAVARVTGQGEETRGPGIADSFRQVLVKVSGDARLEADPRVSALAQSAGDAVASFSYRDRMEGIPVHDEQGTRDRPYDLTVSFVPEKIDAALKSLGREPWKGPRPAIVAFVGVRNGEVARTLASDSQGGRDMREALAAAARRYGLSIALPDEAMLLEAKAALAKEPPDRTALDRLAQQTGGDVALAGPLVWDKAAGGWVADWRLATDGETHAWGVSGVSFDAAFRKAAGGAAQILSGHGAPE
jgi:hypothetical protein